MNIIYVYYLGTTYGMRDSLFVVRDSLFVMRGSSCFRFQVSGLASLRSAVPQALSRCSLFVVRCSLFEI